MGSLNRDRMIPHPLHLGDVLRLEGWLIAWCDDCGNQRILPLRPLRNRFGPDAVVADLARHLVCRMCGGRSGRIEAKFPR